MEGTGETAQSCGIWLAPSTIPGSGLGMYAGREFRKDESLQAVGDLVIPIWDIEDHADQYNKEKWRFLWDEYTWDSESLRIDHEGSFVVNVASPGFGAAANSFLAIFNVEEFNPDPFLDKLNQYGLPGQEAFDVDLELD